MLQSFTVSTDQEGTHLVSSICSLYEEIEVVNAFRKVFHPNWSDFGLGLDFYFVVSITPVRNLGFTLDSCIIVTCLVPPL